jgi:hypothetical protein
LLESYAFVEYSLMQASSLLEYRSAMLRITQAELAGEIENLTSSPSKLSISVIVDAIGFIYYLP